MTLHSSSGERESLNRIGWSRVRRSRRDEMNSLPHVLWMLAEKVAPAGAGSFMSTPANRRKGHAGFPCRGRHRKPSCPLLRGGSRPSVPPRRPAPHRAFGVRSSHAARAAQTVLPQAHPQVSRQPSRTQAVMPPAFAARRGCGDNSLPKPGRKWGLGKQIVSFRHVSRYL